MTDRPFSLMARDGSRRPPVYEDIGPRVQEIIKQREQWLGIGVGALLLPSLADIAEGLGYRRWTPYLVEAAYAAGLGSSQEGERPGANLLSAATGYSVRYVDGYVGVPPELPPSYLEAVTPSSTDQVKTLADEIISVHGPDVARAIASIIPQRLAESD